jgi:S-adenosyl methyltransferase
MPRDGRTAAPNRLLVAARERLPSPNRPGQCLSRTELAAAVTAELRRNRHNVKVDYRFVWQLEQGKVSWPPQERRDALRAVLKVATNAEIGLFDPRKTRKVGPASLSDVESGKAAGRALDTTVAHPARRYNYWLGGKDHFPADRASGDAVAAAFPTVVLAAQENRAFLRRAVWFTAKAGVRQFLDIGTGLPVPDNTHEIAQRVDPSCRVLYVDNDPLVTSHARALIVGGSHGRTDYLEADVRDPAAILAHPALSATLDLGRPVVLMLVAVLHFIQDDDQADAIVRALLNALPPGSYLILSHFTMDYADAELVARYEQALAAGEADAFPRTAAQLGHLLRGLEITEPGIVAVSEWRGDDERPAPAQVAIYGAVARKP